jgi:hypothetical protein
MSLADGDAIETTSMNALRGLLILFRRGLHVLIPKPAFKFLGFVPVRSLLAEYPEAPEYSPEAFYHTIGNKLQWTTN